MENIFSSALPTITAKTVRRESWELSAGYSSQVSFGWGKDGWREIWAENEVTLNTNRYPNKQTRPTEEMVWEQWRDYDCWSASVIFLEVLGIVPEICLKKRNHHHAVQYSYAYITKVRSVSLPWFGWFPFFL